MSYIFIILLVESNYLFKLEKIGENFVNQSIALELDEELLNHPHELYLKPFVEDESIIEMEIFLQRNLMLSLIKGDLFDGGEVIIIGTLRPKAFFTKGC